MKKTVLISSFFQKNKAATVTVSLLMLVSVFVMCWIQGFYDYRMRYVNTLDGCVGERDLYMQFTVQPDEAETKAREFISQVSKMECVEHVLYNVKTYWSDGEKFYEVNYFPKGTQDYIDFGNNIQDYAGGDSIECLAGHGAANKDQVLKLSTYGEKEHNEKKRLNFKVMGVLDKNFLYPDFMTSGGASTITASQLLRQTRLLDKDDKLIDSTAQNTEIYVLFVTGEKFPDFAGAQECHYDFNFYVKYKDNASERQKESARKFISEHGDFLKISKIIENSKETEIADIKRITLLPQLVLGVVTFACCAIILLIMQEKMQEYSIYYLCGYSKGKIISLCFGSLSLMIIIPCIINLFIIVFNEKISDAFGISFGTVIYSGRQILFTMAYLLLVLLITGIIELGMIVKMSPIEMYRRMTR